MSVIRNVTVPVGSTKPPVVEPLSASPMNNGVGILDTTGSLIEPL